MRLPVDNHVITSNYGERILKGKKEFHAGLDFISRENNNVYAIADGIVTYDMDDYDDLKRWTDIKHSAGNYLIISHGINNKLYFARYLHLGYNLFQVGQRVKEGDTIGKYGDFGYSFGAHLHFDMWDERWTKANGHTIINPFAIFHAAGLL